MLLHQVRILPLTTRPEQLIWECGTRGKQNGTTIWDLHGPPFMADCRPSYDPLLQLVLNEGVAFSVYKVFIGDRNFRSSI